MPLPHQASPFGGPFRGAPRKLDAYAGFARPLGDNESVRNSDGSHSTEITMTAQTPEGDWVIIPSLWMAPRAPGNGQGGPIRLTNEDGAWQTAQRYEETTGVRFPRYASLEEAETAAEDRSAGGGAAQGALSRMAGDKPTKRQALSSMAR